MSKEIYEWDAVAAGNNFLPADGGAPEGMTRKVVNDAARERASTMRRWYDDMDWQKVSIQGPDAADIGVFTRTSTTTFTIQMPSSADLTGFFPAGRLLQFYDADVVSGLTTQVVSAVFSVDTTTVTTTDSAPKHINAAADEVRVYFSSSARGLALQNSNEIFYIPETADSAGLQAAIDLASGANGGTVLLTEISYSITTPIDITGTKGQLIIQGTLPETVLLQTAGNNLDELIDIDQASELITFRDVRFNVNRANNLTGLGYCVAVAGNISLSFEGCQFVNCERGVHYTGTSGQRNQFRNCKFFGYEEFGISTNAVTNTHRGTISDCVFDGSSQNVAGCAAIKVAGTWNISNNRFLNMGESAVTPRAIWLWNKSADENGGWRSTVHGNIIDFGSGTNLYGIEIGGSECAVTGNHVAVGTLGKGIFVNGTAASQTIRDCTIVGNVVKGGNCIELEQDSARLVVNSNTVQPDSANAGILVDCSDSEISDNVINAGLVGISVSINASKNSIRDNSLHSQTSDAILVTTAADTLVRGNLITGAPPDGIEVAGTASDTVVEDNDIEASATDGIDIGASTTGNVISRNLIPNSTTAIRIGATTAARLVGNDTIGSTADLVDGGTSTNRYDNSFDKMVIAEHGGIQAMGGVEGNYPVVTGLDLPAGGGAGRYVIEIWGHIATLGTNFTLRLYVGANGNMSDGGAPDSDVMTTLTMPMIVYEFVAADTDRKWGLSESGSGSTTGRFMGRATKIGLE